jgi:hypothetical protein
MLRNTKYALRISYCAFLFFLVACGSTATPTVFVPPLSPKITPSPLISISFSTPTVLVKPATATQPAPIRPSATLALSPTRQTIEPASPTPACTASLRYLQDINYPDGSLVTPGQSVEKQWRVENNGSCDWDERYRLKLLDGFPSLGASSEQALYPARAGFQTTILINFTAPLDGGTYRTSWQAVDPQGIPFGDAIFMEIIVQP